MATKRQDERGDETVGSRVPAAFAAQGAELWFDTQAELLKVADAMLSDWTKRRQEAVETAQRAISRMRECRDWSDWLRIQQDWLAGSAQRLADDFSMLGNTALSVVQRAARGASSASHSGSQRGAEMLAAGGDKPGRRKPAA